MFTIDYGIAKSDGRMSSYNRILYYIMMCINLIVSVLKKQDGKKIDAFEFWHGRRLPRMP